jgi:SP family general alpha glucoside:H+ symporter-like MFS transporter
MAQESLTTLESYHMGPLSLNSTPVGLNESQHRSSPTNDDFFHTISTAIPSLAPLSEEARAATTIEHKMTFRQGCHLYPKAIAWSGLLSMAIVLEAYGTILINGFLGFPAFRQTYGTPTGRQGYEISAAWQAGLVNAAYAGQILGLLFNGVLTDRCGYQRVMVGCLVVLSLFLLLIFFAPNIQMLLAGYVLCGLPWGLVESILHVQLLSLPYSF